MLSIPDKVILPSAAVAVISPLVTSTASVSFVPLTVLFVLSSVTVPVVSVDSPLAEPD